MEELAALVDEKAQEDWAADDGGQNNPFPIRLLYMF